MKNILKKSAKTLAYALSVLLLPIALIVSGLSLGLILRSSKRHK